MYLHANAKLGLAGRLALVRAIEEGMSLKAAAAAFSVSPATVHRWWHRWLDGDRRTSALVDRSSRPHRSPRLLAPELQERICDCRRETGWGPRLVAGGLPRSLRTATSGRVPVTCCTWTPAATPASRDRVTGDRSHRGGGSMRAETRVGYDFAHPIVDDCSRLAYIELHDDERAETVTGFVERALASFAEHGIDTKRLMTNNGFSYVKNHSPRELLAHHGIRHLTTEPHRPRTNGKVERFHQTMARELA